MKGHGIGGKCGGPQKAPGSIVELISVPGIPRVTLLLPDSQPDQKMDTKDRSISSSSLLTVLLLALSAEGSP